MWYNHVHVRSRACQIPCSTVLIWTWHTPPFLFAGLFSQQNGAIAFLSHVSAKIRHTHCAVSRSTGSRFPYLFSNAQDMRQLGYLGGYTKHVLCKSSDISLTWVVRKAIYLDPLVQNNTHGRACSAQAGRDVFGAAKKKRRETSVANCTQRYQVALPANKAKGIRFKADTRHTHVDRLPFPIRCQLWISTHHHEGMAGGLPESLLVRLTANSMNQPPRCWPHQSAPLLRSD